MPITLRLITEVRCESIQEAVQAAADLQMNGGDPIEIVSGHRVVVDGRALRRMISDSVSV